MSRVARFLRFCLIGRFAVLIAVEGAGPVELEELASAKDDLELAEQHIVPAGHWQCSRLGLLSLLRMLLTGQLCRGSHSTLMNWEDGYQFHGTLLFDCLVACATELWTPNTCFCSLSKSTNSAQCNDTTLATRV
jgi:hypothetical protein